MSLFVGRGSVYISQRTVTGAPDGFYHLGNSPMFTIYPGTAYEKYQTFGIVPETMPEIARSGDIPKFELVLDEINSRNINLFFHGTTGSDSAGVALGIYYPGQLDRWTDLDHIDISNVTITGYTEGTDFKVDYANGMIYSYSTGSISEGESLSVTYNYADQTFTSSFTAKEQYYRLKFAGVNHANEDKQVSVDLFKVRIMTPSEIPLITDDFAELKLEGKILYDVLQPDSEFTGGRVMKVRGLVE